jgi:Kelch motif/Putative Ig domain
MKKINRFKQLLSFGLILGLTACLTSCILGPQSKRGTVVDNELRVGEIFLAGGRPAANARVRVIPVGYIPDTLADPIKDASGQISILNTDATGKYVVDSLPDGEYNILADLAGQYAFQDSVILNSKTRMIAADTLDEPGSLAGIVTLQPNHDPRSAIVQVLGTNIYSNVDAQGHFRLMALGGGRYTLRVLTSEAKYSPLLRSITIEAGKKDTLKDTLRLPFFGIPVVQGLRAVFDTAKSIVTLNWNSTDYRDFSEYRIYRDESPALTLSQVPIGSSTDTFFQDSLINVYPFLANDSAVQGKKFEYRIRIWNKSDDFGLTYGNVKIAAAPKSQVATLCTLKVEKVQWDSIHQTDSVTVNVKASNLTRNLTRFSWAAGSQTLMATENLSGLEKTLQRTIKFGWSKVGAYKLFISIADAAGGMKIDSLLIPGNTPPRLDTIPDKPVQVFVPFNIKPKVVDLDGDKLRFIVKNLPIWATFDTTDGTITGTPEDLDLGEYAGIVISVSDGRRTVHSSSFKIHVYANPWTQGIESPQGNPTDPGSAVSLSGKIYLFYGVANIAVFDTSTNFWDYSYSTGSPIINPLYVTCVSIVEDKILVFARTQGNPGFTSSTLIYDPITKSYSKLKDFPGNFEIKGGAVVGDEFYAIGDGQVWSFNLRTNIWKAKKARLPNRNMGFDLRINTLKCVAVNGSILTIGITDTTILNVENDSTQLDIYSFPGSLAALYDPVADSWTPIPRNHPRYNPTLTAVGNKAYLIGGLDDEGTLNKVEVFDFVSRTWIEKPPMPQGLSSMASAAIGAKIYLLQGTGQGSSRPSGAWIYDTSINP